MAFSPSEFVRASCSSLDLVAEHAVCSMLHFDLLAGRKGLFLLLFRFGALFSPFFIA